MHFRFMSLVLIAFALLQSDLHNCSAVESRQPIAVRVVEQGGAHRLERDGQPYFIQGAGGGGSKTLLAQAGGNSFRTWGVGPETERELDEAHELGISVTVGIWLGHKEHGFRYDDPVAVRKQFDEVKRAVLKYKDHPAVLMWGIGNEMEMNNESDELWKAIQEVAKMVHEVDPLHPTMTVIAEMGGDKVQQLHKHCPDIDIIGINTYGGGVSLADRYRAAGATKPFVITEFGPPGTWETKLNEFGAAPELTSTQKANWYRDTYRASVLGAKGRCLGSYAFTWGHKIEATATWFGMLLPDDNRLAAVDTLQELWTGKGPDIRCPSIIELTLTSNDQVDRSAVVTAIVKIGDESKQDLSIEWRLEREQQTYAIASLGANAAPSFPDAITTNGRREVTVTMPDSGGVYRLYCYVRNGHGGAAVGSLPIKARGPVTLIKAVVPQLPLVVYADDQPALPFVPSGWMGNSQATTMQEDCPDNPHSGKTCLRVRYDQTGDWAGVVWQHPADDWGELPGGYDLSNAERLVFWVRGKEGGERVKFGFGLIGIDKKYHDSCKVETEITLTQEWQQITIELSEKELIRIKSGFVWSLAGQGKPVEFYLDDIQYE